MQNDLSTFLMIVFFNPKNIFYSNKIMKKLFLISLTALFLFTISCTHDGFRIEGEVSPNIELNYTTIKLIDKAITDSVYADSTLIENNQFRFKGNINIPRISHLIVTNERDETYNESFVLENGTIKVKIDSLGYMYISGTSQNDILSEYKATKRQEMFDIMDYYKTARKTYSQDWNNVVDSISNVMNQMRKDGAKSDFQYAKKYVNTIAGTYIFEAIVHQLTFQQREEILSLMSNKTKQIPSIKAIITAQKTAIGSTYIDLQSTTHYGKEVQLSDYVGKTDYLLLDFWSSGCQPCIASLPALKTFYNKNRGGKLEIVGISLDIEKDDWLNAIQKNELNWVQISDLKSESEAAKLYDIIAIPSTILIDKEGKIVAKNNTIEQMQEIINRKK